MKQSFDLLGGIGSLVKNKTVTIKLNLTGTNFTPVFDRLGVHIEIEGTTVRVPDGQELVVRDDLGGQIPKIDDGPWPAFPADLTSIAVVLATQARGLCLLIRSSLFTSTLSPR